MRTHPFLVGLLCAWLGFAAALFAHNYSNANRAKRQAYVNTWLAAHHCVRVGYTGSFPQPYYRCADGQVYLETDIPQEPEQ